MKRLNVPSLSHEKLPFRSSKPVERKRKYEHVSLELTLSSSYPTKMLKPLPSKNVSVTPTTSFYDHDVVASATRNLLDGSCSSSEIKKEHDAVASTTRNIQDGSCSYSEIKKEPKEEEETGVSTELSLSLHNKVISKDYNNFIKPENMESSSCSFLDESDDDDRRARVSAELCLFPVEPIRVPIDEDVWKIKKKLMKSDLGDLSRLLVQSGPVNQHILPLLGEEQVKKIMETADGIKVSVLDCDKATKHDLVFKRWGSSRSYVFVNGWIPEFVKRRNLKIGDTVGLYWDQSNSRFNFKLLQRSMNL